jgi:voltage-gated potassium channel
VPAPATERDSIWPKQLTAWERATNMPLIVLALLFLVAFAVPIIYPDIPRAGHHVATAVNLAVWALFAVDFVVRITLAGKGNRLRFVLKHPLDLIMVLIPLARPLRLLRLVLVAIEAVNRHARTSLRTKASVYLAGVMGLILVVSSLAVLDAEQGRDGAEIHNFGDALWWSIVTATTVGYGDMVPVTATGRMYAAVLMFAAIGMVGLVSGSLASWFVSRIGPGDEDAEEEAAQLRARLSVMERQVAELHAAVVRREPPAPDEPDRVP